MITFIAGGTGFIGRRLVPLLAHAVCTTARTVSGVLQIINDIRKEEGLPEVAPR
jgi:nucleoside-diphosphate-sugar epimerase